jgi:adenylosuccinate lyase
VVADAVSSTGSAAAAFVRVVEGLHVDAPAMRRSIDGTHGVVFAERAMMRLVPVCGRERAARIVADALAAAAGGADFADALFAHRDALAVLTDEDRRTFTSPETYLGCAEAFRRRLLHEDRD